MQNLTQYTDAALNAAAPGDSIVVYYHYWTFDKQDGSPDPTNIALLKQYIEHLKSRGDVLFTTLGGQHFLGGGWSAWASLGGQLASGTGPAASSWGAGRLDAFVQGTDNVLWHKWYTGKWSGWESIDGALTSSPAATSRWSGTIDVFMRGSDGALSYGLWRE